MGIIIKTIIAIIAIIHCYIFWFEVFKWEIRGPKVFPSFPRDLFPKTKALAANMGLYNLFLGLGLLWTFFIENLEWKDNISLFFLGCVTIAGVFGALTAEKKIFFIQALPAVTGIVLILSN